MQFAIKVLSKSDLTFFEYHFRRHQEQARLVSMQGTKQKAINLNSDVFIDIMFPSAGRVGGKLRYLLPLSVYGPGTRSEPYTKPRKVLSPGYGGKNWRLNGELFPDPEFDPARYHSLVPGDLAVFGVEGEESPTAISIALVSQSEPDDTALLTALRAVMGNRRMVGLSEEALTALVADAPVGHSIRQLADLELDEALEEAALGSAAGIRRVRSSGSARRMTPEALRAARARAEALGRGGEVLLDAWLRKEVSAARLRSSFWVADENAVNSWDFDVVETDGTPVRVEVKSTSGDFGRPIHISQAEIESAAEPGAPRTDLYRISSFREGSASLRVAKDIAGLAASVLAATETLGPGIRPDGYTVDVEQFASWSPPLLISMPDDEDEDE